VVALDRHLERFVLAHRWGPADWVFEWLGRIGMGGIVWLALGLLAAVRLRRASVLVAVSMSALLSGVTVTILQQLFDRRRPPLVFHDVHLLLPLPAHGSFPSGHATTSFSCALVLASFARQRRVRAAFFALALTIAFSRLYVGVHFPLDVLGGSLIGLAEGALVLQLVRRLEQTSQNQAARRKQRHPQPDPAPVDGEEVPRHPDQPG
jgi:undecaprenyl-diphosphatase